MSSHAPSPGGLEPRIDTDAELILRAYELWGEECAGKLLGDFAFALWDGRRRQLYCARDALGLKPFYYTVDGQAIRFASTAGALFAGRTAAWRPNRDLLALYLLRRFDEPEETLDEGVLRLPPAHFLIVRDQQVRKVRYWDLDPGRQVRYSSDEEYADHFRELFRKAVLARLRSHGPMGSTLSGGLDSSSVVCTAGRLFREGLAQGAGFETFSMSYTGLPCDESAYLDAVVQQEGLAHNRFPHQELLPWLDFERAAAFPDIYYFATLYAQVPLLKAARSRGMRAMLYGIGGDDLLTVWTEYLTDLWRGGEWKRLRAALRQGAALARFTPLSILSSLSSADYPACSQGFAAPLAQPGAQRAVARVDRTHRRPHAGSTRPFALQVRCRGDSRPSPSRRFMTTSSAAGTSIARSRSWKASTRITASKHAIRFLIGGWSNSFLQSRRSNGATLPASKPSSDVRCAEYCRNLSGFVKTRPNSRVYWTMSSRPGNPRSYRICFGRRCSPTLG